MHSRLLVNFLFSSLTQNDNQALLEKLIAAGAKINIRALPPGVIPPLIQVSRRQQEKKQPKAGITRLSYKSPLFYACEVNARSCIEALLDAGADPHWRDPFSNRNVTPTLLAYRKDPRKFQQNSHVLRVSCHQLKSQKAKLVALEKQGVLTSPY